MQLRWVAEEDGLLNISESVNVSGISFLSVLTYVATLKGELYTCSVSRTSSAVITA